MAQDDTSGGTPVDVPATATTHLRVVSPSGVDGFETYDKPGSDSEVRIVVTRGGVDVPSALADDVISRALSVGVAIEKVEA